MHEIKFIASFGDEKKKVWLHLPEGGGPGWHVHVDGYHYGVLFFRNGEWVYFDTWLETADIQVLGDMIEQEGFLTK